MPTHTPSRTSTALALTLLLVNGSGLWVFTFQVSKTESNQGLENADGLPGVYYEVKPGDTVGLSKHYDVPVDELKEVNGLAQAQGLAAGQLLIPTPMEGFRKAPNERVLSRPSNHRPAQPTSTCHCGRWTANTWAGPWQMAMASFTELFVPSAKRLMKESPGSPRGHPRVGGPRW